jgi:hypothetical protein
VKENIPKYCISLFVLASSAFTMHHSVEESAVENLDSSARVLLSTVVNKLLPAVHHANTAVGKGADAQTINWSDVMVRKLL